MIRLLLPAGFLTLASLLTLSSISTGLHSNLFELQLLWALLGVSFVVLFFIFDWRPLINYRWLIVGMYVIAILLLLAVLVTSPLIRNTHSWFAVGPLRFQPVELVKISLIFLYARFFSRHHVSIARWRTIAVSLAYFAIPALLVLKQPDLGSTLVLFGLWLVFLLVSGLPPRRILLGIFVMAAAGFLLWSYGLKGYQKERILAVFYPKMDQLGINYSVIQSKTAIGSAGWWGKGYGQGSQIKLGFLTEPEGDFILAAFVEEWGLLGAIFLIIAFLALIFEILRIGIRAGHNFEKFICLGTAIVFCVQFFLNAGSAVGISPVIGVTFPFLSYGGSSILTSFFLLAIVNAIGLRTSFST